MGSAGVGVALRAARGSREFSAFNYHSLSSCLEEGTAMCEMLGMGRQALHLTIGVLLIFAWTKELQGEKR